MFLTLIVVAVIYRFVASSGFVNLRFDSLHLSLWSFHHLQFFKGLIKVFSVS
jgi:hypothetical protein